MILDDGIEKRRVSLDSPTKGILIENLVWQKCIVSRMTVSY